jgi:hypothetical protein
MKQAFSFHPLPVENSKFTREIFFLNSCSENYQTRAAGNKEIYFGLLGIRALSFNYQRWRARREIGRRAPAWPQH